MRSPGSIQVDPDASLSPVDALLIALYDPRILIRQVVLKSMLHPPPRGRPGERHSPRRTGPFPSLPSAPALLREEIPWNRTIGRRPTPELSPAADPDTRFTPPILSGKIE